MEKRIWIHNPNKTPMHVGSDIVPPGETKDFPESRVPRHLRPAEPVKEQPAASTINETLVELLKGSVKNISAALTDMSTAEVEMVGEMEQKGQNRKGVLAAVSTLLLARAADENLAKIAAMSDDELAAALLEAGTDINVNPDYLAALEAEDARRKQAAIATMSDAGLSAAIEAARTGGDVDPGYLAALEAEAAKRNPGGAE